MTHDSPPPPSQAQVDALVRELAAASRRQRDLCDQAAVMIAQFERLLIEERMKGEKEHERTN